MSSQQKRSFRLPWAPERESGEGAGAATLDDGQADSARRDLLEGEEGGDLGEGPFHFADAPTPEASTDASPEAPDVPETTGEAAMIDAESMRSQDAEDAPQDTNQGAWPTTDQPTGPEPSGQQATPPPIRVQGDPRSGRRENPLVAGLVKAMREAAIASREETANRLQSDASARVEAIRQAATEQAVELRKRADEDIAGIREWSKNEIARIRQQTEDRIEGRRTELTAQAEHHEAGVERQVEQVQSTVSAFEADIETFFEQLLAENDPARLAALAERAPEPPDLPGELTTPAEWQGVAWTDGTLEADAAAEAEAAATEGLDLSTSEQWPATMPSAARHSDGPADDLESDGATHSRLFVNGLTSVAGISAFKGALGQLPGVRSVSVSSGEPGVFIFTVVHNPEADIEAGVAGLTTFSTRITETSDDGLTVAAHEPAA